MPRLVPVVALSLVLAGLLSGCAPDTGDAVNACMTGMTGLTKDSVGTTDADLERLAEAAEICQKQADADPAGFIALWLN